MEIEPEKKRGTSITFLNIILVLKQRSKTRFWTSKLTFECFKCIFWTSMSIICCPITYYWLSMSILKCRNSLRGGRGAPRAARPRGGGAAARGGGGDGNGGGDGGFPRTLESGRSPGPTCPGTKYPVWGIPHFDNLQDQMSLKNYPVRAPCELGGRCREAHAETMYSSLLLRRTVVQESFGINTGSCQICYLRNLCKIHS